MVGSRRSSLNHGLSLKAQYEAALHDLTDLVDTAQDKMAADQKMTVASVIEVQMLLDKHKVRRMVKGGSISLKCSIIVVPISFFYNIVFLKYRSFSRVWNAI